ncbi:MAG: hypothetical protein KKH94_07785 [Candidatus Omnitrophica bacterium]|nr:hypothetical protein [Candidatus Omnitrophota bacterium]
MKSKQFFTIFAIPKPFDGFIDIIQRNAIKSWTLLEPKPEIILFGNEAGVADIAEEFHLRHEPYVACNPCGTPLLDYVFKTAQQKATNDRLAYLNADIIIMNDFLSAITAVENHLNNYLLIGQRYNIRINELIDFNKNQWKDLLKTQVFEKGELYAWTGMDYFVFPKGLVREIPSFTVGRAGWDSWVVWNALSRGIDVVDVTASVLAIHQKHDYAHLERGHEDVFTGAEAKENYRLAHEQFRSIKDANWLFISNKLIHRPSESLGNIPKLYAAWNDNVYINRNLTHVLHPLSIQKVALVGTGANAIRLFQDLQREKIDVVTFLDSNVSLHDKKIEDAPINAFAWIEKNKREVDAVLLSIEGKHDLCIKDIIRELIEGEPLFIFSWKDLLAMQEGNRIVHCLPQQQLSLCDSKG